MTLDINCPERTGRVDTYTIKDEKNLSYREDHSKIINVFLPKSYNGNKPHGILYFFDSQNLFSNAGYYTKHADPYGGWRLDTALLQLAEKHGINMIAVGIDNADKYRDQELFPDPQGFGRLSSFAVAFPDEDYSSGHLEALSDFMMQTLHPFICTNYCVDEDNIGIGGASMGGIASFYCALREFGFYKYVLAYSPAFALYENGAFESYFESKHFAENFEKLPKMHIYCGEGDQLERMLAPAARGMKSLLERHGYPSHFIFESYSAENPHNEESWRMILSESFEKLLEL